MVSVKRAALSPLEKFKMQNELIKKFGKKALLIYNSIPYESPISTDELKKQFVELSPTYFTQVIEFMINKGMVEQVFGEEREEEKEGVEEIEKKEELKEEPEIEEQEEKPKEEALEREEKEVEVEEPSLQREEEKESISPVSKEKVEQEGLEEKEQKETESIEEEIEIEPEIIEPESEEEKQEEKEEEQKPKQEEQKEELGELTPFEEEVKRRFGETAVRIFRDIKSGKTIPEVYEEYGEKLPNLDEFISFLKEVGYIVEEEKPKEEEEEERFSPMASEVKEEYKITDKSSIRVVEDISSSVFEKARLKMLLSLTFGRDGRKVFEKIKKGMDEISIVRATKVPLNIVEKIFDKLEKEKYIKSRFMSREEVKRRFGEDSYIVYKKYGKEGVLFYELIGGEMQLKDIAKLLGIKDKEKIVEIFLFIHDLLNIEIPVDRELLLKRLS